MNALQDIDPDVNFYDSLEKCQSYTPNEFNLKFQNVCGLNILHVNARSLNKNFESLSVFLSTIKTSFSIIAISETWISQTPLIPFHIEGYIFINSYRIEGRGGGVLFFISNLLEYKVRSDITCTEEVKNDIELLFIDVLTCNHIKNTIGVVQNAQFQY